MTARTSGAYAADTIAAIATPAGRGAIGVIRISGSAALAIGERVTDGALQPRRALHRTFYDSTGHPLDDGLALAFAGPASFTGEDVVELQGHGGPVVMQLLLEAVVELGARPARPGEFSERAFLNDKLDLSQAEAIADLIDSASGAAARGAVRSLQGVFSERIDTLGAAIADLRVYVEAAIDFPDEDIDFLAEGDVSARLEALRAALDKVVAEAGQGALLRDGMNVVLAGKPNAGKSSLLNALARRDAAIVTSVAGTTRDVLSERVELDGMPLHIIDTAGLRESDDPVEQAGVQRARAEIDNADRVLVVVDAQTSINEVSDIDALIGRMPQLASVEAARITIVRNKIDLLGEVPGFDGAVAPPVARLCALTGEGLEALVDHLKGLMGYQGAHETAFTARTRHMEALARTREALLAAERALAETRAGELVADDLRIAHDALGEIVGQVSSDALLGRIFASFCIGK